MPLTNSSTPWCTFRLLAFQILYTITASASLLSWFIKLVTVQWWHNQFNSLVHPYTPPPPPPPYTKHSCWIFLHTLLVKLQLKNKCSIVSFSLAQNTQVSSTVIIPILLSLSLVFSLLWHKSHSITANLSPNQFIPLHLLPFIPQFPHNRFY